MNALVRGALKRPYTVVVAAMTPGAPTTKRGVVLQAGQTVDIGPLVVDAKPPPK